MSDEMPEWGKKLIKQYRPYLEEKEALEKKGKFRCSQCGEIKPLSELGSAYREYCSVCSSRWRDEGGFHALH